MPTYMALSYTEDIDFSREDLVEERAEYTEFRAGAGAVIRGGAALYPTAAATTVRVTAKGGDVLTTDGPYAETKEVLIGFYLIEAADLDEAIAVAARMPAAWRGAVEVRPVIQLSG